MERELGKKKATMPSTHVLLLSLSLLAALLATILAYINNRQELLINNDEDTITTYCYDHISTLDPSFSPSPLSQHL